MDIARLLVLSGAKVTETSALTADLYELQAQMHFQLGQRPRKQFVLKAQLLYLIRGVIVVMNFCFAPLKLYRRYISDHLWTAMRQFESIDLSANRLQEIVVASSLNLKATRLDVSDNRFSIFPTELNITTLVC